MKPKNAGEISSHLISSRRAPAPAPARPTRAASHLRRPSRAASKRPRARLLRPRSNPDRESKRSRGGGGRRRPLDRRTPSSASEVSNLGGGGGGCFESTNPTACCGLWREREREKKTGKGVGVGDGRWGVGLPAGGGRIGAVRGADSPAASAIYLFECQRVGWIPAALSVGAWRA